ncbi:hypothetical protein Gotur_016279 [Gossypium turneri]
MISSVGDTDSTSIPPKHLPAEYLDENIQVEEELEIYAATKGYKRRNYTEEEEELEIGATILGFMDELMENLGELFVAHSLDIYGILRESTTGQKACPCHFVETAANARQASSGVPVHVESSSTGDFRVFLLRPGRWVLSGLRS